MEEKNKRKGRLKDGKPIEAIETLLLMIDYNLNKELRIAYKNKQKYLIILGIHAAALTISEALFNEKSLSGYKKFLEMFIDGDETDKKFSLIANKIHGLRNDTAHQWLSEKGYDFGFDESSHNGWFQKNEVTYFNPYLYCDSYLSAFSSEGKIWEYEKFLDDQSLEEVKERILKKYSAILVT